MTQARHKYSTSIIRNGAVYKGAAENSFEEALQKGGLVTGGLVKMRGAGIL